MAIFEASTQCDGDSSSIGWTAERLQQASYKDLGSPAQVEERFYRHLLLSSSCRDALEVLLRESSTTTRDYSISIDSFDLLDADPILGHLLLQYPATLLPLLENAVVRAQGDLLRQIGAQHARTGESAPTTTTLTVKGGGSGGEGAAASGATTRVHARLVHLPPYCFKPILANMQAQDVGKIVQVTGTVVRTSQVQMYESARTYQCHGKKGCGRSFVVHADMEARNNALTPPERCPLVLADGKRCPGTNLKASENGSVYTDYQEIKIQEAASRLGVGHIPRSLLIKLQHDLVDTAAPGDEVVVVGLLLAQWQSQTMVPGVECQVGMAMSAHSIRVVADKGSSAWKNSGINSVGEMEKFNKEFEAFWAENANQLLPIKARDFICKAVCPKLYGLQVIKLALLITLIGGVSSEAYEDHQGPTSRHFTNDDNSRYSNEEPEAFQLAVDDDTASNSALYYGDSGPSSHNSAHRRNKVNQEQVKTRRRDLSHLLLVGDPGTGKSQILRFAAALCPRSVLTTGVGTTSAGLTCAAVREGNGKEFALEAGALVLGDRGVTCIDEFGCIQAQDRTTIHEAMEQQTLSVAKAGIVCKLNCRTTIIAVMNPRDCLYDNQASLSTNTGLGTPLLSRFDLIFKLVDASDVERDSDVTTYLLNRAIEGGGFDAELHGPNDENVDEEPWTMEKLRAYISVVKERFQPVMSDKAALLLERHYERCRCAQSNTIPFTVRFLESLIRLSQAHARLMWRNTVELEDAVAVVRVMECSAFAYGGFDGNVPDFENVMYVDPMTVDFSDEADVDFLCFQYRLLKRYNMLEYLDEDRRRKAEQELRVATACNSYSNWQEVENASNASAQGWTFNTAPTHFPGAGAGHWPPPDNGMSVARNAQLSTGHTPAAAPDDSRMLPHFTQDHYGRIHYTQTTKYYGKRLRES